MKRIILSALLCITLVSTSLAQDKRDDKDEEKKGFKKENLFTGGSLSLGLSSNTFSAGGNPVLGYSLTKWLDGGLVFNYNYTSYKDVYVFNDRIHQSVYGAGAFVKLYPLRFLFAQGQVEHNFIQLKYLPPNNGTITKAKTDGNSVLIGGGYTTGRYGRGGGPHYYLSVLFDVSGNTNSPYTDAYGRTIPIIRAGLQIPLFQGARKYRG